MSNIYTQFLTDGTGLTTTSANHLANIAKQEYTDDEKFLESVSFVDTDIFLIGQQHPTRTHSGMTSEHLMKIREAIERIGNLKGFIAWCREAISAKEQYINAVESDIQFDEWCQATHGWSTAYPDKEGHVLSELKMPVEDKAKYFALEAMIAAYGQFIHPNNPGSTAYNKLVNVINNPNKVSLDGANTIIEQYTPSLSSEQVKGCFDSIRNKWRELSAEFNSIKFKLNEADDAEKNRINDEYVNRYKIRNEKYQAYRIEWQGVIDIERKRRQNLKIFIPEHFQQTLKYLQFLGKKK